MKIIDAFWEKKNLGLDTVEIEIEKNDDKKALKNLEKLEQKYHYMVIKVPREKTGFIHDLEKKGYNFIDVQFGLKKSLLKKEAYPSLFKRYKKDLDCVLVDSDAALNSLLAHITKEMFSTDRISLDPKLGASLSQVRYKNWIRNCYKDGTHELYEIILKGKRIGFLLVREKEDEKSLYIPLAGLYPTHQKQGFGFLIMASQIMIGTRKKRPFLRGSVSINNPDILNFYFSFGCRITEVTYILRKLRTPR